VLQEDNELIGIIWAKPDVWSGNFELSGSAILKKNAGHLNGSWTMKLISAAAFLAGVAMAVPALAQTYNPATNAVVDGTSGATTGAIIGCIVTIPVGCAPGAAVGAAIGGGAGAAAGVASTPTYPPPPPAYYPYYR
jgi:hypothetical protein